MIKHLMQQLMNGILKVKHGPAADQTVKPFATRSTSIIKALTDHWCVKETVIRNGTYMSRSNLGAKGFTVISIGWSSGAKVSSR